jgi:membrane protease subunit (stomatin/prohibitin family)
MMGRGRVVRRRPLLRAAVVGGGSYAAGRAMGRRAQEQEQEQEQASAAETQDQRISAPEGQQAAAASTGSSADQLGQLSTLHQQGALTDDEFAAAKAKVLGS